MRNIIYLITALLILASTNAGGQSIELVGVLTEDYPVIMAEFDAYDAAGNEIKNLEPGDVTVYESGNPRQVVDIKCPEGLSKFSAILTIDRSYSMEESNPDGIKRIDAAKQAAITFIEQLPEDRYECAVTTFSSGIRGSLIMQDFTTDKDLLKQAVIDIELLGGTDYNAAYFGTDYDDPGIFDLIAKAKYKPISIFMTDGEHDSQSWGPFLSLDIIDKANETNTTIYTLTLGMSTPPKLKSVATDTDGQWYDNLTTQNDIEEIYIDILSKATEISNPAPCYVKWIGDCDSGQLELQLNKGGGASVAETYHLPDKVLPHLEIEIDKRDFLNVPINEYRTRKVRITARNNNVEIDGYNSGSPAFTVNNWGGSDPPFTIEEDKFRDIFIRYEPIDTAYYPADFQFESNLCSMETLAPYGGYIYANNLYAGESLVDQPVGTIIQSAICNKTGKAIEVTDINIVDGDAANFELLEPITPFTIRSNECHSIKVEFTPDTLGAHIANFEFFSGESKYSSTITGVGIGNAGIASVKSVNMGDLLCESDIRDTLIRFNNTGLVDLTISDMEIIGQDADDFSFSPPPAVPVTIKPEGFTEVGIRFDPDDPGQKTAILRIYSNAENAQEYDIQLSGNKERIELTKLTDTLDFGVVCPEPGTEKVSENVVMNSGTTEMNFDITTTAAEFFVNPDNLDIESGGKPMLTVVVEPQGSEGIFTGELIFTDTECGYEIRVPVKATSIKPDFDTKEIKILSNVGVESSGTFTLYNNKDIPIEIKEADNTLPEFSYIAPTLPQTVPARDSITIEYSFEPGEDKTYVNYLLLSGDQCDFTDSVKITGYPQAATAEIFIDRHTGLIGDVVQIPVMLINKDLFAESGVTQVNTSVAFNATLLEPVAPTPAGNVTGNTRTIELNGLPVSGNQDETIYTLNLRVLDATADQTILDIENTSSDASVIFNETDGLFSVMAATADIIIGSVQAMPGEKFELPIEIASAQNLSADIHESISFDIRYNATLFEPINDTPEGAMDGQERVITLSTTALPENESAAPINYKFRAMLGNAESTPIKVENAKAGNGRIDFAIENGKFNLENICREGGDRLFDPFASAGLAPVAPNPASGNIRIEFTTSEKGYTQLRMLDALGNPVADIYSGIPQPGSHSTEISASDMPTGVYFIIMNTPTQNFHRSVIIQK